MLTPISRDRVCCYREETVLASERRCAAAKLTGRDEKAKETIEKLQTELAAARETAGIQAKEADAIQAAEQEKLVAHLQQIAARRILQLGLSRGWCAWVGEYEAQRRQRQLLAAAAGRLLRPKLSACLSIWVHEWESAMMLAAAKEKLAKSSEVDTLRKQMEQMKQAHLLLTHYCSPPATASHSLLLTPR